MVLASEPENYIPNSGKKSGGIVYLADEESFDIRYDGYEAYVDRAGDISYLSTHSGIAYMTLHTGDQQEGTNPGKGRGNNKDGSSYDVDISWYVYVPSGETAYLTIYVAPGINPGGVLQFSSWGTNVINTGPRVRVWADGTYEDFLYSWTFTNQLTVVVEEP